MVDTLVVIGGSTGGLEAVLSLLQQLPTSYQLPIVLVLHQRANRISGITEVLQSYTHLHVMEPEDKQPLEMGYLYVAPPNYHLLVEKEKVLSFSTDLPVNFCRPAIDVTLETAADAFKQRLIACILSGANKDGAVGAIKVKRYGGKVYVQEITDAVATVMPNAAGEAVSVDGWVTMTELATLLVGLDVGEPKG
ncbi:MAG: chemotaxis protein CheB [Pseudomonadales bacterium]|nr:chemotaxis protein CheB [Pseudomonadales bacterium]